MNLPLNTHPYAQTALAYFKDLRNLLKRPVVQRLVFLIAAFVFIAGVAVSYALRPDLFASLSGRHVLFLSLVLAPILVIVGSVVFQITCRIGGMHIGPVEAIKISVLSSAANYLPLPGGPALRVAAMMDKGVALKVSTFANIATALVWFGATFLHASIWAGLINSALWIALSILGFICLVSGVSIIWSISQRIVDIVLMVAATTVAAMVYAIGFWVSLEALGFDGSFAQAVVISVAGVIGAAVSFVPSGLGVRELAAASIALWIATDPAIGFMASAVMHMATIVPLILMALYFSINARPSRAE